MIRIHLRFGWDLERLSSHLITNPCKGSDGMDLRNRMPDARVRELWAMYSMLISFHQHMEDYRTQNTKNTFK